MIIGPIHGVINEAVSTSLRSAGNYARGKVMTPDNEVDLSAPEGRRAVGERIPAPGYDRAQLEVGIVHVGVGGFHRAHQAMYLDRLLSQPETRARGAGLGHLRRRPDARRPAQEGTLFTAQDGLYTLVLKHPDGSTEPRVIGSIARYLYAPDEPERVLAVLADPQTRIVSLTITEGGYNFNQVTGEFDAGQPGRPGRPAARAPRRGPCSASWSRRCAAAATAAVPPFTVMSCDNLPGNGDIARAMFAAFADLADPELGAWLRAEVAFPNWMVDRITPVTTPEDIQQLERDFGVRDGLTVVCEPFTQWVLQDEFPLGRPPWERCGVQLVSDVVPYELMKLRLLNASHQAMAYAGYLAGYRYAHEVAADPVFAEFLLGYMQREGRPDAARGARRRPRRVHRHAAGAVRQPGHPRHAGPAGRLQLGPDSQVAGAGDPREPGPRRRGRRARPPWWPPGPGTTRARMSPASRSRWWTGARRS